jgi:hypothetical protein
VIDWGKFWSSESRILFIDGSEANGRRANGICESGKLFPKVLQCMEGQKCDRNQRNFFKW